MWLKSYLKDVKMCLYNVGFFQFADLCSDIRPLSHTKPWNWTLRHHTHIPKCKHTTHVWLGCTVELLRLCVVDIRKEFNCCRVVVFFKMTQFALSHTKRDVLLHQNRMDRLWRCEQLNQEPIPHVCLCYAMYSVLHANTTALSTAPWLNQIKCKNAKK